MKTLRSGLLAVSLLCMSMVAAVSQTVYSGPNFTASFNGPVNVSTFNNATNSNTSYFATDGTIITRVIVRNVNHPIAVDFTSSQFYRNHQCEGGDIAETLLDSTNSAYYAGHPFTYGACSYTYNGVPYFTLQRSIIINATTVIFISMDVPQSIAARSTTTDSDGGNNAFLGWVNFENSLSIK